MSVTYNLKRVLSKGLRDYHAPIHWEICGVEATVKPDPTVDGEREWKAILEEWLPKFDEVGWLDSLQAIYIGNGAARRDSSGQYSPDATIQLETEPELGWETELVVNAERESILIHEFIHHAHLTLNDFEGSGQPVIRETDIKSAVSYYAGTNIGEAIAEIGVSIVRGRDLPEWVHDYYAEHDGPQAAYELANG